MKKKLPGWRYACLFGRGVFQDLRNRLPYYKADWLDDAFNYRVIPSTVFIFFTNLLPAIAFAQDMFDRTENSYGVNEVLLASALGGLVFGIFGGQPLCIVGVTGPISIFNYTVYDFVKDRPHCQYFSFMCWIGLWSFVMHFAIAMLNGAQYTRYITRYSCDAFGLFINCIYVQKGIQILTRQFKQSDGYASGYFSVVVALLMAIFGVGAQLFGSQTHYFHPVVRKVFADYGAPLSVVFFTGFTHFNKHTMESVGLQRLNISKSFHPTAMERHGQWFVRFWEGISVGNVFLAIPFAILLTLLFYFDHNVSSLMSQDSRFKLKKPSSFHWDFLLLGITTGVTGLIGVPFPNGLIPQAPLHTASLCYYKRVPRDVGKKSDGDLSSSSSEDGEFANASEGNASTTFNSSHIKNKHDSINGNIPPQTKSNTDPYDYHSYNYRPSSSSNDKSGSAQANANDDANDSDDTLYEMQLAGVVEQRVTNTVQGLLTLGMMSRPLLIVLQTVPQAVFAGLFFVMGITGLHGNDIVNNIRYLCTDRKFIPKEHKFRQLSSIKWLYLFVLLELAAFGFEFAICQTKGAIAFPAVLLFFAALAMGFGKVFSKRDLKLLDEPTGSKYLLETLKVSVNDDKNEGKHHV